MHSQLVQIIFYKFSKLRRYNLKVESQIFLHIVNFPVELLLVIETTKSERKRGRERERERERLIECSFSFLTPSTKRFLQHSSSKCKLLSFEKKTNLGEPRLKWDLTP